MSVLEYVPVVGKTEVGRWSVVNVWPTSKAGVHDRVVVDQAGVVVVVARAEGEDDRVMEAGDEVVAQIDGWVNSQERDFGVVREIVDQEESLKECLLVVIDERKLRIWGKNGGRVILLRRGKVGQIFRGKEQGWRVIEGDWKPGDRLLVGTEELVDEMSEMLLLEVLSMPRKDAGEELVTRVQAAEDSATAAGLLMEFSQDEVGSVENIEEVMDSVEVKEAEPALPEVFLKTDNAKRKKAVALGVLILILLSISISLGWWKREQMRMESLFEATQTEVEIKLGQAVAVAEDNPVKAKELTRQATETLASIESEFIGKDEYQEKIGGLKAQIETTYRQVSGEISMAEVPIWFDLNLVKEGMFGEKMAYDSGRVVVLDANQQLLASIRTETKEAELVGGGELLKGSTLVDVMGKKGVVLAESGLVEVEIEKKTSGLLQAKETEWQRVAGMGLFGSSVYLLDVGANTIWQYPGTGSALGQRQRWLKGEDQDLTTEVDMVIDGDIWTVDSKGVVDKYRRGVEENFSIDGLLEPMIEVVAIDVPAESEKVYILDRGGKRVVVLSKETGSYERQIIWEGLGAVTDMVVDEAEGQVLVLSGAEIFALKL
jgi:hypothetical protein